MKTSRIVVFHGPGQPLAGVTTPIPALRDGEILVRNEYTTLCRSDLNTFAGKRTEKTPTILGHEIVGRIEELGPGAPALDLRGAPLRVGDRITWAIYASDPCSCLAQRGIPQKGPGLFKYGHEPITAESALHGGLGEHCLLRRHTPAIRLDETVPLAVAALINCAVATVAGSLRLAGEVAGRRVLIAGAGMLGVIAAAMSRLAGAETVVAVDVDDARLEGARRFGADRVVKLDADGRALAAALAALPGGIDVALDYSGVPETMEAALAALGVGGTLVMIGATYPQRAIQVNAERMVRQVLTLRGLHNYNAQDLIAAVDFVERQHTRFPLASLVQEGFDLDTVEQAFACALGGGAYRVGLRPVCRREA